MDDDMTSLVSSSESGGDSSESDTDIMLDAYEIQSIINMARARRLVIMQAVFSAWLGVWASVRFGIFGSGRRT